MQTITEPAVFTASAADEQMLIAPLLLSFASDPAVRWMYPNAHQYRTFFPTFIRAFAGKAFAAGTAHYVEDFRGAALWLPPGEEPDDSVLGPLLAETVAPSRHTEVFAVFEQMGAHHPSTPHWYLPLLGVEPRHQRAGYGAALLRRMLAVCDRSECSAYLEATSPDVVEFYERHGFVATGEIQAGNSPVIVPMVRDAR